MTSQVFNEDCMALMSRYPDNYFDLAVVDPPYGINIAQWDTKEHRPTNEYFEQLFKVSKNQIVWGANYFQLPINDAWICWDKTLGNGKTALGNKFKSEFELAWTSLENMKCKMFRYTYDGNIQGLNGGRVDYNFKSIHPTQKPVALYDWIFKNYLPEGGKVLDTHLGSGSSRIAANRAGNIDFTASELDKDYFEAQEKRWKDYKAQLTLF